MFYVMAGIYFDVMEIQPLVQGFFRFDKSDEKVLNSKVMSGGNF